MAPVDPHSHADSSHPFVCHVSLSMYVDFSSTTIDASALLRLSSPFTGSLSLDTRGLSIKRVVDPLTNSPLPFSHAPPDPIKGSLLSVSLLDHASLLVVYSTSPSASALQWLSPPQTFNKTFPFVYTQCQSIHARSLFPCHDTPAARLRYSARLNIPLHLSAVMAARHSSTRPPSPDLDTPPHEFRDAWFSAGRAIEEFEMDQPIPPYLFAFAVGELGYRDVGPRTRVYGEAVASVLDAAAREFSGAEDMILAGESLFGDYRWERFDLIVLPPSFPYGGMENPRMVFLTPAVIKGDSSGAQVVAHELAHSWTGNLITNINNEHFWLNEGFTTYAERRIVEAVQGEDIAILNAGIGWRGLTDEIERFKETPEFTKLKNDQEGVNPDDVYSQVPYEKGYQFLWRIERQIGRSEFDAFLKKYIDNFAFQSIDTETFLEFLKANIPGIEKEVDLDLWTTGTGIPPDAMEPVSSIYTRIVSLANEFKVGRMPREEEVADWRGQEWELYLENLPKKVEGSQVLALDARYRLSESNDYEVKVGFLQLAISSKCREYMAEVEKTLKSVGRMKYLRVLYTALVQSAENDEEKILANRVFAEARECYHPIAQGVVEGILSKHL